MDKILRLARLEADSSSASAATEWSHWFRTFENFLDSIDNDLAPDKLNTLINYISSDIFVLIADCATYEEAVAALRAAFIKPKNETFAWYILATLRQASAESLNQYIRILIHLAKDCNFQAVGRSCKPRRTYLSLRRIHRWHL